MSVMTHCAHMVVVFHLCVSVGTLSVSAFDNIKLVFAQSKKVSQSNVTHIFSVSLSLSPTKVIPRRDRETQSKEGEEQTGSSKMSQSPPGADRHTAKCE